MRTYNATPQRLRAIADAIERGEVDPEDVRIKATGQAEWLIVSEDTVE